MRAVVEEFVGRLTGKQTIYQMIELAENIERRGGTAEDPLVYKKMYLDRLHAAIAEPFGRPACRTGVHRITTWSRDARSLLEDFAASAA